MTSAFRVSICGGGIGGLTLALVLAKYGEPSQVEIFEAGPTITTVGAGINFYTRTMDVMKDLGLYDQIVNMAIKPPLENTAVDFRKSDQEDGYHWFTNYVTTGQLSVHRKDLIDFLLRQIPGSCKVHLSKKLEFYEVDAETEKVTLHFSDGSSAITDVLVGADGIRSATRTTMYQNLASLARDDNSRRELLECIEPVFTGVTIYRNLIPTDKLSKAYHGEGGFSQKTLYCGRNKHMITFPISQGRLINVIIYLHDGDAFGKPFEGHWMESDVSAKEVSDHFDGWEDRVMAVMKTLERPSKWALHSTRSLPHYVDGKVVLLGDSAHAMEPHFGAGAGQAMEDAYVLGRLLTHELTHRGNIVDALKVYERIRLPFANDVVQRSRLIGRYYAFHRAPADGPGPALGSQEELDYLRKSIEAEWAWQSETARVWDETEERWRAQCGA